MTSLLRVTRRTIQPSYLNIQRRILGLYRGHMFDTTMIGRETVRLVQVSYELMMKKEGEEEEIA